MISFLFIMFVALFGSMTIAAMIGILIKNTSIVDVFWGLGIVVATLFLYIFLPVTLMFNIFILLMALWGFRLALFLFLTRTIKGIQDRRYTEFEKKWGQYKSIRVFSHFYLQSSLQLILCFVFYPFYLVQDMTVGVVQILAILLFIVALLGETIADWQLYKYKVAGNKGIFRDGLWAVSRHPNLFFECLVWVALALFSVNYIGNILAWIAPLCVWIIVRYMTGPYSERLSLEKHKLDYQAYKDTVPMIIPNVMLIKKRKRSEL